MALTIKIDGDTLDLNGTLLRGQVTVEAEGVTIQNGTIDALGALYCLHSLKARFLRLKDMKLKGAKSKLALCTSTRFENVVCELADAQDSFYAVADAEGNVNVEVIGGRTRRVGRPPTGSHADGFQCQGGKRIRIRGHDFDIRFTGWQGSSVIHLEPEHFPIDDVRIIGNRIAGGQTGVNARQTINPFPVRGIYLALNVLEAQTGAPWAVDQAAHANNYAEDNTVLAAA